VITRPAEQISTSQEELFYRVSSINIMFYSVSGYLTRISVLSLWNVG
jgi:hypothetical protein